MEDNEKPAAATPVFSEVLPGQLGEVSAIASASAPFIYTDWIGSHGTNKAGVVNITLEAVRNMLVSGKHVRDRVVVAHLRMPRSALNALKEAIAAIELLEQETASDVKN